MAKQEKSIATLKRDEKNNRSRLGYEYSMAVSLLRQDGFKQKHADYLAKLSQNDPNAAIKIIEENCTNTAVCGKAKRCIRLIHQLTQKRRTLIPKIKAKEGVKR